MNLREFFPNFPETIMGISGAVVGVLVLWSLAWKGFALWRAARRNDKTWFFVLLFVNTLGILEIIYYFVIAKSDCCATKNNECCKK